MKKEKLLVIIVTYNDMPWVQTCFNSLRQSTVESDVYVVDNGSCDGTQQFIQEHYPEVFFFQSNENLGFGKANNLGLQYALDNDYDYVYLLNQDAWVMPDTFERLIYLSKKYPEFGLLSPFQMNADLYNIDYNFAYNSCSLESNPAIINDMYNNRMTDIYPVKTVMAAHWFLPVNTIKIVGGFSPSFPHYGEDDNYIERLFFREIKIGIVPSLKVVHDRGERIDTPDQIMHMNYTFCIRLLSRPTNPSLKTYLLIFLIALRNIIKYRSYKPISYLWKLAVNYRTIRRNRVVSITSMNAFLNSAK